MSRTLGEECSGFGHLRAWSSLICINISSTSITKGVNFTILEGLSSLLLTESRLDEGEFLFLFLPLCLSQVLFLSFCGPSCPIAARASSIFIYFWAFNSISAIDPKGFFARATIKSFNFNPTLNVVSCTLFHLVYFQYLPIKSFHVRSQ